MPDISRVSILLGIAVLNTILCQESRNLVSMCIEVGCITKLCGTEGTGRHQPVSSGLNFVTETAHGPLSG